MHARSDSFRLNRRPYGSSPAENQAISSDRCRCCLSCLHELLGTKLRALYQRSKGRDLFDLAVALDDSKADINAIIEAFVMYMDHGGHHAARTQFQENLAALIQPDYLDASVWQCVLVTNNPWKSWW